jgi:hypothetical protein
MAASRSKKVASITRRSAFRTCSDKPSVVSVSPRTTSFFRPTGRPQHVFGIDRSAVRQNDQPPFRQVSAHRTLRHAESRQAIGQKMPACLALEREGEAVGVSVAHAEAVDRELVGVEDPPPPTARLQRNGYPSLAPESCEHLDDDVECPRAAVDCHDIGALPQPQRRKQTRNAGHVVEMAVRQQEPVQPSDQRRSAATGAAYPPRGRP